MFANANGLHGNIRDLAIAASFLDIVLCAESKVTGRRLLPGYSSPSLLLWGIRPGGLGMALYIQLRTDQKTTRCPPVRWILGTVAGGGRDGDMCGDEK